MKFKVFVISLLMVFVLVGCGDTQADEDAKAGKVIKEVMDEAQAEKEAEKAQAETETETETEDNETVVKKQSYNLYNDTTSLDITLSTIEGNELPKLSIFVYSSLKGATIYGYMLESNIYKNNVDQGTCDVEISAICTVDDETLILSNVFLYSSVSGTLTSDNLTDMLVTSMTEEAFDVDQFGTEFEEAFNDFLSE